MPELLTALMAKFMNLQFPAASVATILASCPRAESATTKHAMIESGDNAAKWALPAALRHALGRDSVESIEPTRRTLG